MVINIWCMQHEIWRKNLKNRDVALIFLHVDFGVPCR